VLRDHRHMRAWQHNSTAENERVAAQLTGQRIAAVWYFLQSDEDDLESWDFGAWHQPTMGVQVATEEGGSFSAMWSQYQEWGFGVDLFAAPAAARLAGGGLWRQADVTGHPAWSPLLGRPVTASFLWNDFGTGRPPCPEAVKLASDAGSLWIITADWERREGKLSIQLGLDDLMVIFNDNLVRALGLYDHDRGREHPRDRRA
jgi:hypothetical protein